MFYRNKKVNAIIFVINVQVNELTSIEAIKNQICNNYFYNREFSTLKTIDNGI